MKRKHKSNKIKIMRAVNYNKSFNFISAMAKTAAERQKAFRERKINEVFKAKERERKRAERLLNNYINDQNGVK